MGKRFLVGWHRRLRRYAISRFPIVATAVAAVFASGSTALAQQEDPTWVLSSGASFTLFPSGDLYPVYVADPHRPTNVLVESFTLGGSIAETDSPLTRLGAGGRFGILRFGPARPEGRAWQISIEAGFDALFDSGNRLDAAGWDGNYGLTLTTTSRRRLAMKIALLHVSAHMGDEYQMRTGRERINYTREEVSIGGVWRWSPQWLAYGETGWAFHRGDAGLEPWRVQSGIHYESAPGRCGRRVACYAAVDLSSMQERNWRMDINAEGGLAVQGLGRTTRIFLEWHDGRPTVNEFFKDTISTLSLGIKVDL